MFFKIWRNITNDQKRLWKIGAGVVGFGSLIKFGYFYGSRVLIIDSLAETDKSARMYLKESQDFAKYASEDRKKRTPKLTEEQREQMQNYLMLVAQHPQNNEVYTHENIRNMKQKRQF
mmetsp:Transcript_4723/g.6116  ORF Transcript_4723/g.6116 Transcript_4723/m.6116 type:complete len:118 (+) Transcript_4723:181-534(+)